MLIATYYQLTKPGIIFGNLTAAVGGYALASQGSIHVLPLTSMLVGLLFVIASACVCNNYQDRFLDAKMTRTQNRALAQGVVSTKKALLFASCLLILGCSILILGTNIQTLSCALLGFVLYVFIYSPSKHKTIHSTLIGSLAGGLPPLVGYSTLGHPLNGGALLLFLSVAVWQMPHFFAIAIYRLDDYVKATIPVYPAKKGLLQTKIQMTLYVIAFALSTTLLTVLHYTGPLFLWAMTPCNLMWLYLSLKGFSVENSVLWARKMFFFSLIAILLLTLMLIGNSLYS